MTWFSTDGKLYRDNSGCIAQKSEILPLIAALRKMAEGSKYYSSVFGMSDDAGQALRAADIPLEEIEVKTVGTKWRRIEGSPLEWASEASDKTVTWQEAGAAAAAMGGRLPTRPELEASIVLACKDNADRLGIRHGWYWTSTSYAPYANYAWIVYMNSGNVSYYNKTNYYHFWACRGGESEIRLSEPPKHAETKHQEIKVGMDYPWNEGKGSAEIEYVTSAPNDADRIIEAIALLSEDAMDKTARIRALKTGGAK